MNFNIGGSGRGGRDGHTVKAKTNNVLPGHVPKARASVENTFAKAMIKGLNVMSFSYSTFAYSFVQNAPGPVIKNFFLLFEAVGNVLIERVELDISNDNDEYECGIAAARIQDALNNYNTTA